MRVGLVLTILSFVLWGNAAAADPIAPHRALYKMSLASVKNGSSVTDVSGKMIFEWADACDGWAVQQRLNLHFVYAEGGESEVDSSSVSWEAKDGSAYHFNARHTTDGKETDSFRGRATVDRHGGKVVYDFPKAKEVKLLAGSLFPSAHTLLIVQKAQAGEKMFVQRVFDGSDEEGSSDISAFIDAPLPATARTVLAEKVRGKALLESPAWPVRLAFFKPNSETGEPDYEMDLVLQANGVARRMRIDYGDFVLSGDLEELEPLSGAGCPG